MFGVVANHAQTTPNHHTFIFDSGEALSYRGHSTFLIANVGQCTPQINLNGMVGGAYDHLKGCCSTLVSNLKLDQQ